MSKREHPLPSTRVENFFTHAAVYLISSFCVTLIGFVAIPILTEPLKAYGSKLLPRNAFEIIFWSMLLSYAFIGPLITILFSLYRYPQGHKTLYSFGVGIGVYLISSCLFLALGVSLFKENNPGMLLSSYPISFFVLGPLLTIIYAHFRGLPKEEKDKRKNG